MTTAGEALVDFTTEKGEFASGTTDIKVGLPKGNVIHNVVTNSEEFAPAETETIVNLSAGKYYLLVTDANFSSRHEQYSFKLTK